MELNQKTIDEFKKQLIYEKNKLESDLSLFAKKTDTPGEFETQINNIGSDEDENATEVEEYTDNLALEKSLESQLKDVMSALKRIEKNNFGKCLNCKEFIEIERLRAYPAAKNCIKCNN